MRFFFTAQGVFSFKAKHHVDWFQTKKNKILNNFDAFLFVCHKVIDDNTTLINKGTFLNYVIRLGGWGFKNVKIVHFFSLQISDVHRQLPKTCWFWTIVKQKNVSLSRCRDKKNKKASELLCLFFASFILETRRWNNSEKDKTKKRCFFSKGKCSLFCFWS